MINSRLFLLSLFFRLLSPMYPRSQVLQLSISSAVYTVMFFVQRLTFAWLCRALFCPFGLVCFVSLRTFILACFWSSGFASPLFPLHHLQVPFAVVHPNCGELSPEVTGGTGSRSDTYSCFYLCAAEVTMRWSRMDIKLNEKCKEKIND